jgi:hypothetical protein
VSWNDVHSYAVETELWTSLAINAWVILGGAIFLATRAWRTALPFENQIRTAGTWSAAIVSVAIIVIMLASVVGIGPALGLRFLPIYIGVALIYFVFASRDLLRG